MEAADAVGNQVVLRASRGIAGRLPAAAALPLGQHLLENQETRETCKATASSTKQWRRNRASFKNRRMTVVKLGLGALFLSSHIASARIGASARLFRLPKGASAISRGPGEHLLVHCPAAGPRAGAPALPGAARGAGCRLRCRPKATRWAAGASAACSPPTACGPSSPVRLRRLAPPIPTRCTRRPNRLLGQPAPRPRTGSGWATSHTCPAKAVAGFTWPSGSTAARAKSSALGPPGRHAGRARNSALRLGVAEARLEVSHFIAYYKAERRHSALGYLAPKHFSKPRSNSVRLN